MELRVFGRAILRLGWNAGGGGDFHAQPGTRLAYAGGGGGAPEREFVFRIAAATAGGAGGFGTYRRPVREDSVWCGVWEQKRIGYSFIECAETSGSVRHAGVRWGIHEEQAGPGSVSAGGGESWRGPEGLPGV